jgi:heterodisulfide reductase subunit B
MKYSYYPGCSLESGAVEYDLSSREVLRLLGVELTEIPDWTCCGASAVEPVSRLLTLALPARNLALAEREAPDADMLVPCSACYLNHMRVERECEADRKLAARVNEALSAEGLSRSGTVRVRHLLDVLARDVGPERVGQAVVRRLEGLTVAPYYGCQVLRPYPLFDDPERPASMEPLLKALGVEVLDWDMGGRCCGRLFSWLRCIPGAWAAGVAGPRSWPPSARRHWPWCPPSWTRPLRRISSSRSAPCAR